MDFLLIQLSCTRNEGQQRFRDSQVGQKIKLNLLARRYKRANGASAPGMLVVGGCFVCSVSSSRSRYTIAAIGRSHLWSTHKQVIVMHRGSLAVRAPSPFHSSRRDRVLGCSRCARRLGCGPRRRHVRRAHCSQRLAGGGQWAGSRRQQAHAPLTSASFAAFAPPSSAVAESQAASVPSELASTRWPWVVPQVGPPGRAVLERVAFAPRARWTRRCVYVGRRAPGQGRGQGRG